MELTVIKGREIIDSGLAEQILEFDRVNMRAVLEAAGIDFPEENRRRGWRKPAENCLKIRRSSRS